MIILLPDHIHLLPCLRTVDLTKHEHMKTLFVATDFSPASHNAFLYSLELAKALPAKIILFHAYQQVVIPNPETAVVVLDEEQQKMAEDRLHQHLRAAGKNVSCTVELMYREGLPAVAIGENAVRLKADYIVTGIKESGKGFRKWFGSTITALMRHCSIPQLVIPEDIHYHPPSRLALANDMTIDTDAHTLDPLIAIGQCFHSKVYILRINRHKLEEVYELLDRPARLGNLQRVLETEYQYFHNKHIGEAIIDFVAHEKLDMLAFIPHHHQFLERLFGKSHSKEMIFKTKVPLLLLPEKKKDAASTVVRHTDQKINVQKSSSL